MVSNIFKVNGLNLHLGCESYSDIIQMLVDNGEISIDDMYQTSIVTEGSKSDRIYKRKIYTAICKALKNIANKDYDTFINHYYNHSYYGENAKENISDFLDGVATVYPYLRIAPGKSFDLRFPFGKKFSLCYKINKKNYTEIVIDTDDIDCFFGNINFFVIHFKSGLAFYFQDGSVKFSAEITDLSELIDTIKPTKNILTLREQLSNAWEAFLTIYARVGVILYSAVAILAVVLFFFCLFTGKLF